MPGKFELKRSQKKFMFSLKAPNGRIILTSARYATKRSAENGIKSVKKHARADKNYDRRTAKNGSPYFVLVASNGEIIGSSEMYSGTSGRASGINSVKKNGPSAKIEDLT